MIRILGGALVVLGAGLIGFLGARALERRVCAAESFVAALELLARELSLRLTPLPELFAQLSVRCPGAAGDFFSACVRTLDAALPLSAAWEELLAQVSELDGDSRRILAPLGQILGRYEAQGQNDAVECVRSELAAHCRAAREESRRLGKVYRALGMTAGIFLVILLL